MKIEKNFSHFCNQIGKNSGVYTGTPSSNIWDNIIFTVPNGATNVTITNKKYHDVEIGKKNALAKHFTSNAMLQSGSQSPIVHKAARKNSTQQRAEL